MKPAEIISLISPDQLLAATLSGPLSPIGPWGKKVSIRPLIIKGERLFQITFLKENKALHKNVSAVACQETLTELLSSFKQAQFFTVEADFHVNLGSKGLSCKRRLPSLKSKADSHDRQKQHLLPDGVPDSYLIELGLMSGSGLVIASKAHKFRQINRFLELVSQWLEDLTIDQPLHIVDLGCGKAYLTFALYHYLHEIKGLDIHLTGVDLKGDVIQECQTLAHNLGYHGLTFLQESIDVFTPLEPVDIIVSLHACNLATDYALAKGVEWEAQFLFAAPCCQHELYQQVSCTALTTLLQHGIMKERFAALVTDAARAELLEAVGYDTQVIEFIDLEHSPKNLMIRARKNPSPQKQKRALEKYLQLKQLLNIDPTLEKLLHNRLS